MGCYSYICNHCHGNLRGGEKVHLTHVRHGQVLGEVEGTYNEYGSVKEETTFDKWDGVPSTDPNCHDEVMASCFDFKDSAQLELQEQVRIYEGKEYDFLAFVDMKCMENPDKYSSSKWWPHPSLDWYIRDQFIPEFEALEYAKGFEPASGVAAYHARCYDVAKKKGTLTMTPSKSDPDQGCGAARKKFL